MNKAMHKMARLFDNILKDTDIAEEEEIYFEDGKAKALVMTMHFFDNNVASAHCVQLQRNARG